MKKLLGLFDDLETIFNVNESESESENESESDSVNDNVNENENESVNENENESVNENENDNENENKSDDGQYYKIKQINDIFKMIDKKSSEDQIDLLKKYLG